MSETKTRKVHLPAFKAKVGLESLREVQTINEIGQEYGVHLRLRQVAHATSNGLTFFGLPPSRPFARAADAFPSDNTLPPFFPI